MKREFLTPEMLSTLRRLAADRHAWLPYGRGEAIKYSMVLALVNRRFVTVLRYPADEKKVRITLEGIAALDAITAHERTHASHP